MDLHKLKLLLLAMPKTLYFNFRYFPFWEAVKLPVIVSHRVALQCMQGEILIQAPIRPNMIRIGFHENPAFDRRDRAVWYNKGKVIFENTAYIGNGGCIANTGTLTLGDNFQLSGNSRIVCKYKTTFRRDTLIGWDCLFMDGDAHRVYPLDNRGGVQNESREIYIGEHVWFGARCTVTKGVIIGNGCVVAANSCIVKPINKDNCIIGGYPAKVIREEIRWEG